uniref:CUB and sushi domain-containing protein 3 n=1 Tax=Talaromyces marneffei PM1 TaxID=1077442 RepID=A0A093USI4_TALMA
MAVLDLLRGLLLVLRILPAGLFPNHGSRCGGNGIGVLFFIHNGEILGPGLPGEYSLAWNPSTRLFLLLLDGLHGGSRGVASVGSPAPAVLVIPMVPHGIDTLTYIYT